MIVPAMKPHISANSAMPSHRYSTARRRPPALPPRARRSVAGASAGLDRFADSTVDRDPGEVGLRVLRLPEREDVRLRARLDEGDLQRPLVDRVVLANQLVEAAVAEKAVPLLVDVGAA